MSVQFISSLYSQDGETALHLASRNGWTAVVRVLLDHGADVYAVDEVGRYGVLLDGRVRIAHFFLYLLDAYNVCQY